MNRISKFEGKNNVSNFEMQLLEFHLDVCFVMEKILKKSLSY